ncbi:hypothetical protein ABIC83_002976 [Roseateles asaccharophilus]|uniref:DUF262 domain-containing protein n=1 Tax=Roseateles asaccharophilus TaxID=582607 RepID=UPI0038393BC7
MRIRQSFVELSTILKDVRSGRLLPAAFQRPYVWSKDDVLAMCESLLRGIPIGSFLIWSPGAHEDLSSAARHRLGPITASTSLGFGYHSMLLDGQNRLATLAWIMNDGSAPIPGDLTDQERGVWGSDVLVLDLGERRLKFVPAAAAAEGFVIPAWTLIRNPRTNQLCRDLYNTSWSHLSEAERDAGSEYLDRCIDAFSNALVIVTEMQDATRQEALDAFKHICRVGVPMSEQDFAVALAAN